MTRRPDPHARFEELAAGHALHALEPEDEQEFVNHLSGCARCEADLAEHSATLAHLAYAPAAADPPPALLESIRAGVLASGRGASFPESPAPQRADDSGTDELSRARDARRLRRAATWLGAAAAFALVMTLAFWNTSLRSDREQQVAWGERMEQALDRLSDDDADRIALESGDDVVAVAVVRGADMSLVVEGLPVNAEGTTYVLWGETHDGDKVAVGAFDVTSEFDVLDGMHVRNGVADMARLMVTREAGNAPPLTPTLPVLAVGEV